MKKILLVLCCFLCTNAFAQELPLDFTNNQDTFIGFSGSGFAFRTVTPSSTANPGGQFFNDGSNAFQGFYIDLAQALVLNDNNKVFTLQFYSFDPNNHNIVLKLEDNNNTDVQVKTTFSVPSPSDWTTVSFDFSNAQVSDTGQPINATGSYGRLTIFIDEGTNTPGTYIIDDITNGDMAEPPTDPHALDVLYNDLVWSDEFDSSSGNNPLDAVKWHHQTIGPNGGQWFNGEAQHYTDRLDNSYIENGFLNIVAKKELNYQQNGVILDYTSARLNSKFAFTYGRIDVRAKLPSGDGTWPAIWTLGKNINETGAYWQTQGFGTTTWPACGEIDIMEHGLHSEDEVSCAIHTPSSFGATVNTTTQLLTDVSENFHVYSINWSPNQITFMIDGVGYYTYNPTVKDSNTWPFAEDQFILLNVALGGISGTIDANFVASSMVIDYVRVYQNLSLSTNSELDSNSIKIYPNPTTGLISLSSPKVSIDSVKVYNIHGQLIKTVISNFDKIDVSTLHPGVYITKVYFDNNFSTYKIIKQ